MSKITLRIANFHSDPLLNTATQRGFEKMGSPDVLAIFAKAAPDAAKAEILDALGGETISQPHLGNYLDAYLIRSGRETFFTLCELFDAGSVKGASVKADLHNEFRRVEAEGVTLEARNLVLVGVRPEPALS